MNFGIIGYGNIARKFVKSITYTSGGRVHAIASHSLDENDRYLPVSYTHLTLPTIA
mgnify:CR=1 FL=1